MSFAYIGLIKRDLNKTFKQTINCRGKQNASAQRKHLLALLKASKR